MKKIGTALKGFFKEQGITQQQIAERLEVSQPYVNSLLSGEKEFGKKQARIFGDLFGISPNWLLTGEGEMLTHQTIHATNSTVVGSNIKGNGNQIMHNDLSEMIKLQQGYQELLQKNQDLLLNKDEQINRLIAIIEKHTR